MPLRLAVGQGEPELTRLGDEVIDGFLVFPVNRPVFKEKAPAVQVQRDGRREMILLFPTAGENVTVGFIDPVVQPAQRANRRAEVDVRAEVAEAPKTGG